MFDQLNRFMALLVLFGLLTRPAMAVPDGYQTLVVDGDTLVVQMAESLPTEEPSLAASDDSLSAQTKAMETSLDYWTGRIEQNTTWRDTVYVIGDVTIASGATLTLAPDTQVHFMPYHDDTQGGLDPTRAELVVEGRLQAQAEGIVFCSANARSLGGDWYGIVVKRGGLADVSNATIRYGLRCLYAKMGGRVTMDHVAFANCGKLIGVSQNSTGPPKVKEREEEDDIRGKKLVAGVGGLVGALTGGIIAVFSWEVIPPPEAEPGTDPSMSNALRALNTLIHGMWGGNIVGTAVGVSRVDPLDNFLITLAGSALVGAGVPYAIALTEWAESEGGESLLILSGLLGPIVGATIASEVWRKPLSAKLHLKPEARRVSVGLVPDPKGGLSAVATLRF